MYCADVFRYFETLERLAGRQRSGKVACAEALGVTKGAVYAWKELVPVLSAALLADITGGALKFDPYLYVERGWHKPPGWRLTATSEHTDATVTRSAA